MGDCSTTAETCTFAGVGAFLGLTAVLLAGCGAGTHSAAPRHSLGAETLAAMHSCGYLRVGKGWRLNVSHNESCNSARRLMRVFFTTRKCLAAQRQPGKSCMLGGYACVELPSQPDTGKAWCSDARRDITAALNP